jgi:hypothetical protein
MPGKIARIEELLGDTITEVTLYRTPSGALFKTKEEAITSIIAIACPHADSKSVGNISNKGCVARTVRSGIF